MYSREEFANGSVLLNPDKKFVSRKILFCLLAKQSIYIFLFSEACQKKEISRKNNLRLSDGAFKFEICQINVKLIQSLLLVKRTPDACHKTYKELF